MLTQLEWVVDGFSLIACLNSLQVESCALGVPCDQLFAAYANLYSFVFIRVQCL